MNYAKFFLSFGGLGFLPKMTGTWGSLGGIFLALFLSPFWMLFFICVFFISSVFVIHLLVIQNKLQEDDPSWIVIDEVVGQMIPLSLLGVSLPCLLISFISFRFFDILKPWPIRSLEVYCASKKSMWALGVMLDDVLAGIAATIVTYACLRLL